MANRKHYVVFYSPGTLVAESSEREISSWDTHKAMKLAADIIERYGAKPYGFYFVTRIHAADVPDGEGGYLHVQPKEVDRSGMYYINGKVESLAQVEARNDPKEKILRENMRGNGWNFVVRTANGYSWTQPFEKNDRVVDSDGNVIEVKNV